jgi:hypothetical protein
MVAAVPVFRALLLMLSRNSAVWVHLQIPKVVVLSPTSGRCNQAAGHVSPGKEQDPLPIRNVKSQTSPQIVGINDSPVPKTDTQETENLDKAISLDQEGASMCSLPISNMQAQDGWQWLLFISLTLSYLPLTWDLSRSKVHSLSWLAKRLRACSLVGNGAVQESRRRSKDSLNLQVTEDGDLRNF